MPSLVLIDGGIGQLHSAAAALEAIGVLNQPLASIAKKEEILYVYATRMSRSSSTTVRRPAPGSDDPRRGAPFAVTFHRNRRNARTLTSELNTIPGIGPNGRETTEALRQPEPRQRSVRRRTRRRGGKGSGGPPRRSLRNH